VATAYVCVGRVIAGGESILNTKIEAFRGTNNVRIVPNVRPRFPIVRGEYEIEAAGRRRARRGQTNGIGFSEFQTNVFVRSFYIRKTYTAPTVVDGRYSVGTDLLLFFRRSRVIIVYVYCRSFSRGIDFSPTVYRSVNTQRRVSPTVVIIILLFVRLSKHLRFLRSTASFV